MNALTLITLAALVILAFKFITRKRKKKNRKLAKLKFICIMLITGMFWTPLTLVYCVKNPGQALIYASKLGITALRIKGDVTKTMVRLDNKLKPYTPTAARNKVQHTYDRYARDAHSLTVEVADPAVKLGKAPKPSLFVKVCSGVLNIGKFMIKPLVGLI